MSGETERDYLEGNDAQHEREVEFHDGENIEAELTPLQALLKEWESHPRDSTSQEAAAIRLRAALAAAVVAPRYMPVRGYCPACRKASLFLTAGEHVACVRLECTNPTAVDDVLHDRRALSMVLALIATADSGPQEWCGRDGCLAVGWDHDHAAGSA